MRVTVTIDVPEGFHHAIKPVAEMCGLSYDEICQRYINLIANSAAKGVDIHALLSDPNCMFALFPELEPVIPESVRQVVQSRTPAADAFDFKTLLRKA